jgi:hypothetical protein
MTLQNPTNTYSYNQEKKNKLNSAIINELK